MATTDSREEEPIILRNMFTLGETLMNVPAAVLNRYILLCRRKMDKTEFS